MHRILLLALFLLALPVQATVFTVTKTADTLDGYCHDRDCSLREAISAANAPDLSGRINVVVVPAGIYRLTRAGAGEDGNAAGDLDLNSQMILVGAGAGSTILDGGGLDRVLDTRGPVEIFGVTIRNGRVDGDGGGLLVRGAGSSQPVLLHRSVVSGNLAQNGGSGGGIVVQGYLEVRDSAVLENQAEGNGGGISAGDGGQVTVRNVTVSGNLAHGSGGGLAGSMDVSGSTIVLNEAHVSGGGIGSAPDSEIFGSIVAQNTSPQDPDCQGAASLGYNVFGVGGCQPQPTDKHGTLASPLPAVSEVLSGGFGPTPVHPPYLGGPAEDMVAAPFCEAADQVGQARSAPCDAGALELSANPVCIPGGSVLCLQGGRFRVTASWRTAGQIEATPAQAVPLTDDSGTFWFFAPDNLEIMVKVLNGCPLNQRWWVFSSGLTNVGVTLRVEDLVGRRVKFYVQSAGTTYAPRLDTDALECSPTPGSAAGGPTALAATGLASRVFEVTKTADAADGSCDHNCSLREAVIASEEQQGTDVIVLRPGDHLLALAGAGEDEALTGDLDVTQDLVVLGAGAKRTILDGGGIDRVLDVLSGGRLELYDVTVRGGWARPDLFNAGDGGGIQAAGSSLELVRSTVTANSAENVGGGISSFSPLEIRDSTISGNTALESGGGLAAGDVDLENVTISGNRAEVLGGGFFFFRFEASLRNVTISGNTAQLGGGLAVIEDDCPFVCFGPFEMERTLIAGNSVDGEPSTADCFGATPRSGAHNLFGIGGACGPGLDDTAGSVGKPLDPRLTPLGDHGGPTPTHGLLADSPAVDLAGSCSGTDQRGRPRPAGAGCDAGAFERQPGCQPDEHTLCLGAGDRFRVTATWEGIGDGHSGPGGALPLAVDTGAFWFFEPDNLELTVKVLDGCGLNDRFWVFLSGLTDVQVDIRVEDTRTGEIWTHHHDFGTPLQPRLDTNALDVCHGS